MTAQTRIAETVARAITSVTDNATGHYQAKAARQEIRHRLFAGVTWDDPEIGDEIEEATATKYEQQYRNSRKPRINSGTLFDPTAVLALGGGDRVFMDDSTDVDLIRWARLSHDNRKRVDNADDHIQHYVTSRVVDLRANPGWKLGRVERDLHDWTWDYAEAQEDDSDSDDD